MKKYVITFNYIPPMLAFTPMLLIPTESTVITAIDENDAWNKFLNTFNIEQKSYVHKIDICLYN